LSYNSWKKYSLKKYIYRKIAKLFIPFIFIMDGSNNIYDILRDLQNNQRRYLQVVSDALEIINTQSSSGGFRRSLNNYSRGTTAAAAAAAPIEDTMSFEFVSFLNPASILSLLRDVSGQTLLRDVSGQTLLRDVSVQTGGVSTQLDISNNTTIYAQPLLPEPVTCPITLEPIEVGANVMKITRCGHVFKEAALRRWFQRDLRCPVCRGSI
jgi:hypothetical protein